MEILSLVLERRGVAFRMVIILLHKSSQSGVVLGENAYFYFGRCSCGLDLSDSEEILVMVMVSSFNRRIAMDGLSLFKKGLKL